MRISPFGHLSIAVVSAGSLFFFRWLLDPWLQENSAYIFFLAATALAAWAGGFVPSLITLGLGLVLTHWFFLHPRYQFHLASTDDWTNTLGYAFVGLALAWFSKHFRAIPCALPAAMERAATRREEQSLVSLPASPAINPHQATVQARSTEQELEQQLAAARTASAEAVQQLDSFVYTVSHDLRAPLRAIKGFTIALREDYDPIFEDEGKQYARRIVDATERLEQMLAALLTYSRLGRGEVPLMKVELEPCVTKASQKWAAETQAKDGRFEIARPLPAVIANPVLLDQVLDQLLSNAFKFVPPGATPSVTLQTQDFGHVVRIQVLDNGIGIEQKHFPKLFQVFQRFAPADAYPGLGIGLAMVRKAAEKMGGVIGAQSQPGQGSCFWIELPRHIS